MFDLFNKEYCYHNTHKFLIRCMENAETERIKFRWNQMWEDFLNDEINIQQLHTRMYMLKNIKKMGKGLPKPGKI